MSLDIIRYDAAAFEGSKIPAPGEVTPVEVVGLNGEGLEFVEEEIGYDLASKLEQSRRYNAPVFPVSRLLRGYAVSSTGDATLRNKSFEPLSGGNLQDGTARIERLEDGKLHVAWQADVCFTGIGTVAKSRAAATYRVKRPTAKNNPLQIIRTVRAKDTAIELTPAFEGWMTRNGIIGRSPRR